MLEETSSDVSLPPSRLQGNILINEANVTLSGTACVNGIIHEIDSFLVSPSVERGSHTASPVSTTGTLCLFVWRSVGLTLFSPEQLNLTDVAARNGYTSFYKLMEVRSSVLVPHAVSNGS